MDVPSGHRVHTDGKRLWHRTFYGPGNDSAGLRSGTVIDGRVRVVQDSLHSVKVITLDMNGRPIGTQRLPMFDEGGIPRLVGGDYRMLVVEDVSTAADTAKYRYVLLTSTR